MVPLGKCSSARAFFRAGRAPTKDKQASLQGGTEQLFLTLFLVVYTKFFLSSKLTPVNTTDVIEDSWITSCDSASITYAVRCQFSSVQFSSVQFSSVPASLEYAETTAQGGRIR